MARGFSAATWDLRCSRCHDCKSRPTGRTIAMLFLPFLLFVISFGFVGIAIAIVLYDVYLAFELDRLLRRTDDSPPTPSTTTSPASSDAEVQASAVPPPQTP